LRLPPDLHSTVADTAAQLGLDLTGLIRLMIRRSLPHFQTEARLIQVQAEEAADLLEQWRQRSPKRPIREFWDDYYLHQRTQWWRDVAGHPGHDPRFSIDEAMGGAVDVFAKVPLPVKEQQR
jgi:hypothetical protein